MALALALSGAAAAAPGADGDRPGPRVERASAPPVSKASRPLYVGATGTSTIAAYDVQRSTGVMSPIAGSPYSTGLGFSFVITPDGRTMFVGSLTLGVINTYRVHPDGTLTQIPSGTYAVGDQVIGMALTRDADRLFVSYGLAQSRVVSYHVRGDELVRTSAPEIAITPSKPAVPAWSLIAVSPDSRYLVVDQWQAHEVSTYRIGGDSSLTPISGPMATGAAPAYPTFTPDGRFLYLSDENGGTVTGFRLEDDGRLTRLPGSPYASGTAPHGTAITADGKRMYVTDSMGGQVHGFSIGGDGALTPLPGSPYAGAGSLAVVGRGILSHDERYFYVVEAIATTSSSKVYSFEVRPDGSLVRTGQPGVETGGVFSDGPSMHFTPNQGPTAAVMIKAIRGRKAILSAKASADVDGQIRTYRWVVKHGKRNKTGKRTKKKVIVTTRPRLKHKFRKKGVYRVRLQVTDDEGCSTSRIHTGIAVTCNGSARAVAVVRVRIR